MDLRFFVPPAAGVGRAPGCGLVGHKGSMFGIAGAVGRVRPVERGRREQRGLVGVCFGACEQWGMCVLWVMGGLIKKAYAVEARYRA